MASQINVNQNNNDINISVTENKITVVDRSLPSNIEVTQPVTNVVEVAAGPQGVKGDRGDSLFTQKSGNLYFTTSSIEITGSLAVSGSTIFTGSAILNNYPILTSNSTGSLLLSSSFNAFTSSYNTGSFTGSFTGDGSQLTGIVSSKWSGSNPITREGNVEITGSLRVTGGITASLFGTTSWAENATNAFYAATASNILGGKATHVPFFVTDTSLATSSIYQSGSSTVIINQDNATSDNPEALYVYQPSTSSFNVISGKGNLNNYLQLNIQNTNNGANASSDVVATANNGNESINYIDMGINNENYSSSFIGEANDAYLYSTGRHLHIGNTSNFPVQIFAGGSDTDANKKLQIDPDNQHQLTGSLDVSGSIEAFSFTGSLQGTATNAINAETASYSTTLGASLSQPANNQVRLLNSAGGTLSTAIINNVTSASYADNASTADYAAIAGNGGVSQIIAGSGVALIPSNGQGNVTVIATGVGGVTIISGSLVTGSFTNTTSYTFNHNLSTRTPIITVFDSDYNQIIPENIQLLDTASAIISFPTPETGFAIGSTGGTTGTALSSSYALIAEYANTASFYAETDPIFVAKSASLATTGSNTFRGNQIISGSGINTILQVHGANAEPWAFGIYNDTYNPTQSVLAGFVDNTGEASIGTEVDKPLYIYTNANYVSPTLIISSSGVTIDNTLTVNNGITGSLFGTASFASNALSSSFAQTSSYSANSDLLDGKDSTTFATTGSNIFIGNQTVTGSLFVTGSSTLVGNQVITGSLLVTQSYISTVDYIDFTTTSTPAHLEGRVHWDDGVKTLQLDTENPNFSIDVGHQSVVRVYNNTGADIQAGKVVYINGAQGNTPTVATASWEIDPSSAGTIGFAATTIPGSGGNRHGYVITNGLITNVNTNGIAVGSRLFLSSSGAFTDVAPDAPLHEVRLGVVVVNNATTGVIYVNVVNGFELTELHDVRTTTESNGDLLVYSSSLWTNSKALTGSYSITGSLTISGSSTFTNIGPAVFTGSVGISGSVNMAGSIIPVVSSSFSLGSIDNPWKEIFLKSGSISIESDVPGSPATVISNADGNILLSAGGIQLLGSGSFSAATGSFGYISGSLTHVGTLTQVGDTIITGSLKVSGSMTEIGTTIISGSLTLSSGSALNLNDGFYVNGTKQYNYGQFSSTTSQSGSVNVTSSFNYDTTVYSQGVNIVSGSRIAIPHGGVYNITATTTVDITTNVTTNVYLWLRKNGTNVSNSTIFFQGRAVYHCLALNHVVSASAGDYFEVMKLYDADAPIFRAVAAAGSVPAVPSIITTVTQIA